MSFEKVFILVHVVLIQPLRHGFCYFSRNYFLITQAVSFARFQLLKMDTLEVVRDSLGANFFNCSFIYLVTRDRQQECLAH
jgi:hypothetical protein